MMTTFGGALFNACSSGDETVVEVLLELKSDVNQLDEFSATPLIAAVRNKHLGIVQRLLHARADIAHQQSKNGAAVHVAAEVNCLPILELLVRAHGGTPLPRDAEGLAAVHFAAKGGALESMQYLVGVGESVHDRSCRDFTPLHVAAAHGRFQCVKFLCDCGARVSAQDDFLFTPLHLAAAGNKRDVVKYLIQQSPEAVHVRNVQGGTPLMQAVLKNHLSLVRWLVRKGGASLKDAGLHGTAADMAADRASRDPAFEPLSAWLSRGCAQKCGKIGKKRCTGCESVLYCSVACQAAHWPAHKPRCTV